MSKTSTIMAKTPTTQTKPRKRATIIVKRQYAGNLDMERAFTEVLTRALYKIPMQQPHKEPCIPKTPHNVPF